MIIIQNKLISDEILEAKFVCNLAVCKGACCVEGDFGAPLEDEEKNILTSILEKVKPYLTEDGIKALEENGPYQYYEENEEFGTTLRADGACAFVCFDDQGVAGCGIEKAYEAGKIDFKKPISCHLYPVRVKKEEELGFEALNYDQWEICKAACTLGEASGVSLIDFVKEAIIRKYGEPFYEELKAASAYLSKEQKDK